jgi:hypothetical protein
MVLHHCSSKLVSMGMNLQKFAKLCIKPFMIVSMIYSCCLLKVALLNLVTISSTWARIIDVMNNEVLLLYWFLYWLGLSGYLKLRN